MKLKLGVIALLVGSACYAQPGSPLVLRDLRAIHSLTNAEAARKVPVAFEATVTYCRWYARQLFVQDGDAAIFVFPTKEMKFLPGDRVFVRGITQPSFRPIVQSSEITLISHGPRLQGVQVSYNDLTSVQHDAQLVRVRAVVRSADLIYNIGVRSAYLHLLADGNQIEATLETDDSSAVKGLLEAEVEWTGVSAGTFDDKMQKTGIILHANSLADVKILRRASVDPHSLPVTPMDEILSGYQLRDLSDRVHVRGTITYFQPGTAAVLQDGMRSVWISTQNSGPLQVGDQADATGFPDVHDGFLTLAHGEIQDLHVAAPVKPIPSTWQSLASSNNVVLGHIYDLVSIEGTVVTETREDAKDEYVISADGHLITAIYYHRDRVSLEPLPAMKQVGLGSRVRVTGICIPLSPDPSNGPVPFNILLRSFADLEVISGPSPLNVRNLIIVVGVLCLTVIVVGWRAWLLERKVRRETAAIAYLERRRGKILEDINNSRPLAEILEQIVTWLSAHLRYAPCWIEVADGATLGSPLTGKSLSGLRVAQRAIPGRSGVNLGSLNAAFSGRSKPIQAEGGALTQAAGLAALAIETSRLYTDLVHRSEFDPLTNVQNRFSLERCLENAILDARQSSRVFGLLYMDLNDFKQVNDIYGHRTGDLYLQQVAERLKHRLRPGDLLARLGGDEFAVLIQEVRNRADAEEVAQRLEGCFDEPFICKDVVLQGSASIGIAMYPADSTASDSLFSAADASMYLAKKARRTEPTAHTVRRRRMSGALLR